VADLESVTSEMDVCHAGDDGLPGLIGASLHGSWSLPPESSSFQLTPLMGALRGR